MNLRVLLPATATLVCSVLGCAGTPSPRGPAPATSPTSVIFLISDGAGAAHWTLAAYADDDLALRRMKTIGLVDTRGSDHTVSGSAPTATAYATGVRTFMGAVGVPIRFRTKTFSRSRLRGERARAW